MKVFIHGILLHGICMSNALFCKICKFFIQQHGIPESFGKCGLFPKVEQDFFLVTGIMEQKTDYNYCSTARYIDTMCGEKGTHYQEK